MTVVLRREDEVEESEPEDSEEVGGNKIGAEVAGGIKLLEEELEDGTVDRKEMTLDRDEPPGCTIEGRWAEKCIVAGGRELLEEEVEDTVVVDVWEVVVTVRPFALRTLSRVDWYSSRCSRSI